MSKTLTERQRSILACHGCYIEDWGRIGRLLRNVARSGPPLGAADRLHIRSVCREALAAAGHDVSDLRVGIFGPFPGN